MEECESIAVDMCILEHCEFVHKLVYVGLSSLIHAHTLGIEFAHPEN